MLSCSWLKSELLQRWHSCDQFLYVSSESLGHSASRTDIRLTETLRQRLCMDTASPLNLFVGFEPLVPKVYLSPSPEDCPHSWEAYYECHQLHMNEWYRVGQRLKRALKPHVNAGRCSISLVCHDPLHDTVDGVSDSGMSLFMQDTSLPFWSVDMLYKIMIGWRWIQKGGRGTLKPWKICLPRYIWRSGPNSPTEPQQILNSVGPDDYEETDRLILHRFLFNTGAKLDPREHLAIKNGLLAFAKFLACDAVDHQVGVFVEIDGSDGLIPYCGLRYAKLRVLGCSGVCSGRREVGEIAQTALEDGETKGDGGIKQYERP